MITLLPCEPCCHVCYVSKRKYDCRMNHESEARRPSDVNIETFAINAANQNPLNFQ